jgi:two-component system response regulator HydG
MARILVVDDEESILYTFESFLSDEGHEVLAARDYDEALRRISAADPDVVFSDIILGGKTGIDVLRAVKERGLTSPVVMMTGYPTLDTATEAVRLGAFDYVTKPVVQRVLLRIANMALQHKRVLDERERYRSHLEAIFGSIEDAIITVDREMTILELNDAAMRLCGLARGDIGKRLCDVGLPCKEGFLGAVGETLERTQAVRQGRFEHRREGMPTLVMTLSAVPLLDRTGRSMGAVLVARDETRLAGLEQELGEKTRMRGIVGKSKAMQRVYSLIESLADVETTVLVTGESGTGKELVAEALHHQGIRNAGPLVKVNCSALSEALLESELFGHVKGAFTGAVGDRVGRFQRADGGTIFLDEIGGISPRVQSSLLRVLQEKEFERVGESRPTRVDVRVIAATNKDLKEKIACGQFREDLYYRLAVVNVPLPPLRERCDDIPLLLEHFLGKFNRKLGRSIRAVSSDVERAFMEYSWPGNVRELEHALEHAFILCPGDTLCVDHLPSQLQDGCRGTLGSRETAADEAMAIQEALRKTAGNKARAARLLGIDRKTLYRRLARHNLLEGPSE